MTFEPQAYGPAPSPAIYSDITTGFATCQAHAKANRYAFKRQDRTQFRIVFTCDRAGKYNSRGKKPDIHQSKRRKNTGSKKCDYHMRVSLLKDRDSKEEQ
ncbi:uncharacterized protein RSE6_15012 [Rhynchosporium secalis]|uniref:FAR1 domain-containing protein n=1 Tax=Rhynchosporium secalis TaxID=38038 RepID=A0A1E1MWJ1_RHYSE|nr:uncharacterized protein RSE6_15012 [Rhynchosporium secalis]